MEKIYNIKYVDAYYIYTENIGETKLSPHEAYGYLEINGNNIVIIFIKERGSNNRKTIDKYKNIVKGLVIPDTALMSVVDKYKTNILINMMIDSSVSLTWRDVVYVANSPRYDCGILHTEGILFRIEKDHVVLKDPKTVRVYPKPVKSHPIKKPNYYIIPISFIINIVSLSE